MVSISDIAFGDDLMNLPISGTAPRMGRPPMDVKPMLVRLPEGMAERIDAVAGKNRRAEFIREALEKALKRAEKAADAD
jgi:hypothetical protein